MSKPNRDEGLIRNKKKVIIFSELKHQGPDAVFIFTFTN